MKWDYESLIRLFAATAFDHCDYIWWRTDGEYAPLTVWVNCNDQFYWACADSEEVVPESLELLERSMADCRVARVPYKSGSPVTDDNIADHYGLALYCARRRGMRPQKPFMAGMGPELRALFEACGPERDPKDEG